MNSAPITDRGGPEPEKPSRRKSASSMLREWIGQNIVVDTDTPVVYLGTLASENRQWIELVDADVHDSGDSSSTKDRYIQKARATGIRPNRKKCRIDRRRIVSASLFFDIQKY